MHNYKIEGSVRLCFNKIHTDTGTLLGVCECSQWVQWLHDTFWKETDQKTKIPLASPPTTTKETLVIGVVQLWQIMCIYIYILYHIMYVYIYIDIVYFSNHIYITLQPASPRCRSRNRSPACEETTWSSLQASRSQRPCSSKAEPSEKATCSCLPGGWWRMATKIVGS